MRPEWGHPKPTRGRRLLVISGVAAGTLAIAVVIGLFIVYPKVGESAIRNKLIPKLSKRVGHPIAVDGVDVDLGRAVMTNVTVTDAQSGETLATVPKVVLNFGFGASIMGKIDLETVRVVGAEIVTVVDKDGSTPWDQMRAWLRKKSGGEGGDGKKSGLIPRRAELVGASYELRDKRRGATAVGENLDATFQEGKLVATTEALTVLTTAGPRAELGSVTFRGTIRQLSDTAEIEIGKGEFALWPGMRLTGVAGTVAPGEGRRGLFVDLSGGWGGSEGRVWQAVGNFDPRTRQGNLKIGAERFQLEKLANVLGSTPLRNIDRTSLGAELNITSDGETVTAKGDIEIDKLSLFHRKLAKETVEDVSLTGDVEASYSIEHRLLTLSKANFTSGGVEYQLSGMVRRGESTPLAELKAKFKVPPVECQKVLDSLPKALAPKLQGFELSGTFSTDVDVHIPWDDLEKTTLEGSVGIRDCAVRKAAPGMSAGKLKGQFRHRVIVRFDNGEPVYKVMTIGPKNTSYVSLEAVSPHLVNSLLTTEDSSFYRHRGFIISEFRTALIKNLEAGYFRYGASSITMQIAKNVYLDRAKTLSRKLQELFMTWYIETKVPKKRLMEVYVNAIEYGPALYGIGNASQRYFGKRAMDLNPTESAFFSSILPAPRRRFKQYCRDKITGWTERKIERILALMLKRKRLTQAEYETAMITPLLFRIDKSGCRRR